MRIENDFLNIKRYHFFIRDEAIIFEIRQDTFYKYKFIFKANSPSFSLSLLKPMDSNLGQFMFTIRISRARAAQEAILLNSRDFRAREGRKDH